MFSGVDMATMRISIHAPREGGDVASTLPASAIVTFQSTPPARGATIDGKLGADGDYISIHAPREGGDGAVESQSDPVQAISIHAPREGGDEDRST